VSDYPPNATPVAPAPVSRDLQVYLDAQSNVWARDTASGVAYLLSSSGVGGTAVAASLPMGTPAMPPSVAPVGTMNGQFDSAGTYAVDLAAAFPYTITALVVRVTTGTCTVALNRNGAAIPGATGIAVTTAAQTVPLNQAVAVNDLIEMVITSLGGTQELDFGVHYQS
jgi:hypothetical protein